MSNDDDSSKDANVVSEDSTSSVKMNRFAYRPHLDGVRAFAVIAVILFHCSEPWFAKGFLGVDTFFILSGFLITSTLLIEIEKTGTVSISNFYAKRVRRLLPAFLVMVAVVSICYRMFLPWPILDQVRDSFYAALFYIENYYMISTSNDYWKEDDVTSPLRHCWSLSIEEQFYFVFILFLAAFLKFGGYKRGVTLDYAGETKFYRFYILLSLVITVFAATSLLYGLFLHHWEYPLTELYMDTFARLHQLMIGCVVSLSARLEHVGEKYASSSSGERTSSFLSYCLRFENKFDIYMYMVTNLFFGMLVTLYCVNLFLVKGTRVDFSALQIVCTTITTVLLMSMEGEVIDAERTEDGHEEKGSKSMAIRICSSKPAVVIGRLSYAMYLWHFPIIRFVDTLQSPHLWFLSQENTGIFHLRSIVVCLSSIILAVISKLAIERPISKISVTGLKSWVWSLSGIVFPLVMAVFVSLVLSTNVYHMDETAVHLNFDTQSTGNSIDTMATELEEELYDASNEIQQPDVVSLVRFPNILRDDVTYKLSLPEKTTCQCKGICSHRREGGNSSVVIGIGTDSHSVKSFPMWSAASKELGFEMRYCSNGGTAPFKPFIRPGLGATKATAAQTQKTFKFWKSVKYLDYFVIHSYAIQKLCTLDTPPLTDWCISNTVRLLGEDEQFKKSNMSEYESEFIDRTTQWLALLPMDTMKKVFIVLPEPMSPVAGQVCVATYSNPKEAREKCSFSPDHLTSYPYVVEWLHKMAQSNPKLVIVSVDDIFCPNGLCPGTNRDGSSLWVDTHHPNPSTWIFHANKFFTMLQRRGLAF